MTFDEFSSDVDFRCDGIDETTRQYKYRCVMMTGVERNVSECIVPTNPDARDEFDEAMRLQMVDTLWDHANHKFRETCESIPYNESYARCSRCGISMPRCHGGWWFYCPGCGRELTGERKVAL